MSKKAFCPAKHQDHKEFYRNQRYLRTKYWQQYFLNHPEEEKNETPKEPNK